MSSYDKPKDTSKDDPLKIVRETRKNYQEAADYMGKTEKVWLEIEDIHRKDIAFLDKAIAHLDANQAELDQMSKELKESARQGELQRKQGEFVQRQANSLIERYKALQQKMDSLDNTSPNYAEAKRTLLAEQMKLDAELDSLEKSIKGG